MSIRYVRAVLFAFVVLVVSSSCSFGQVRVSVSFGPPALPVYEQPVCPGDDYIWTPGYWAWDADYDDYYWVPGTWVLAPEPGYLWTPPYWGWVDGAFTFYDGYWGPQVGFYGGINYGFGYFGVGFDGGRWQGGHFFYNRSVSNVNVTVVHNVYNTTVVNNNNASRVSYNGGNGGVVARPTPQEEAAARERHVPPVAAQTQQVQAARGNPQLRASANHGKPPVAATARPGDFSHDAVPAREAGAPYHPPAKTENAGHPEPGHPEAGNTEAAHPETAARPETAVHPNDLPPVEHAAAPNTGNPKLDQKYQKQQQKLEQKQQSERQKLQQQQDKEHQQMAKHNASAATKQQTEQRHQQQTQQLQQRQTQERQAMQQRQAPPASHPESKPR